MSLDGRSCNAGRQPLAEYRKITDEILKRMPDEDRYPRPAAEAVRSFAGAASQRIQRRTRLCLRPSGSETIERREVFDGWVRLRIAVDFGPKITKLTGRIRLIHLDPPGFRTAFASIRRLACLAHQWS